MRVYLAGPYAARERLRGFRNDIAGSIEVTSSWLDETHEVNPGTVGAARDLPTDEVDSLSRRNLSDVAAADVLVLFTGAYVQMQATGNSGGRHVETGYALALGKRVLVVGSPENVFHRLVTVEVYESWGLARHRLIALRDLELTVNRERAEATARADADARRVIDLDRYPGEPVRNYGGDDAA